MPKTIYHTEESRLAAVRENKLRYTAKHKDTSEYKETNLRYMREQRKRHPEKHMVAGARRRAKAKGIDFSITKEDVFIPDVCPVFGIPLIAATGGSTDNSPSLDRIDNSKGYTKDNICVISHKANFMKNSASIEEVKLILSYMEEHLCPTMAQETE